METDGEPHVSAALRPGESLPRCPGEGKIFRSCRESNSRFLSSRVRGLITVLTELYLLLTNKRTRWITESDRDEEWCLYKYKWTDFNMSDWVLKADGNEWRRGSPVQTAHTAGRYSGEAAIPLQYSVTHYLVTVSCNRPWRPIGLWDVEAPTFSLDSRFTDGCEVVSLALRPPFTPKKIPGTHFC
jgi:hypothetical protein